MTLAEFTARQATLTAATELARAHIETVILPKSLPHFPELRIRHIASELVFDTDSINTEHPEFVESERLTAEIMRRNGVDSSNMFLFTPELRMHKEVAASSMLATEVASNVDELIAEYTEQHTTFWLESNILARPYLPQVLKILQDNFGEPLQDLYHVAESINDEAHAASSTPRRLPEALRTLYLQHSDEHRAAVCAQLMELFHGE